jgi:hypothetical protein
LNHHRVLRRVHVTIVTRAQASPAFLSSLGQLRQSRRSVDRQRMCSIASVSDCLRPFALHAPGQEERALFVTRPAYWPRSWAKRKSRVG